jgi:hypothetical protein
LVHNVQDSLKYDDLSREDIARRQESNRLAGPILSVSSNEWRLREFSNCESSDPAVVAKLMIAELHLFSMHMQRKAP